MEVFDSRELIEEAINNNEIVLVYFGTQTCSVCVDMKPKVMEILKGYPKIKSIYVDLEKSHNIAVSYNVFTIPGIIMFIEGKETIREARHISMQELDAKIERYYSLLF